MCVCAWNEKTDRYERLPLHIVIRDKRYHSFHPLSENQLDVESAFEDALDLRDPYLLAESLQAMMLHSHMNDVHIKIFISRLSELVSK